MFKELLQKLCGKLTKHKYSLYIGSTISFEPTSHYYRCRICNKRHWSYNAPTKKQKGVFEDE